MAKRDRTYRGIFVQQDGTELGLDFYAENLSFARAHAAQVAAHEEIHPQHGPLRVRRVVPVEVADFKAGDAGSWYPL